MGSNNIQGMMIISPEPTKLQLEAKCFEKMKNLKFLMDSYANNDKYGSLRDDKISWVCDVHIVTNSRNQRHMVRVRFCDLKCDHLWFYGKPYGQLQQYFGDLMQGDRNHVEVSCKISHWTSRNGKFAPVIARMGVHVECICPPQNSVIIQDNSQNVDDHSIDTEVAPLLPPF
ncbi:hypothetical protein CMV_028902 [Castanea mollissima]|uniref:Uncharacterized protein n=1 Tax=Castanea mollissima TaxID=60419 RepID=A0A8J4QFF6_9ROSI|nr:hypothetical protein CMV_028902 [Castanea mollissima]